MEDLISLFQQLLQRNIRAGDLLWLLLIALVIYVYRKKKITIKIKDKK